MKTSIRSILITQGAVTAVVFSALAFFHYPFLVAFLAGSALITVNFALLALLWNRLFEKKPIATTVIIVVFKYSFLVGFLYFCVSKMHMPVTPLVAGVGTLAGTFLVIAVKNIRSM